MNDASEFRRALNWLAVWKHARLWLAYSIVFGIVAPLVCFGIAIADKDLGFGRATVPLVGFAVIEVAAMAAWLGLGGRWRTCDALLGGMLVGGTLFAIPFAILFGSFGVLMLGASLLQCGDPSSMLFGGLGVQPIFATLAYGIAARRALSAPKLPWPSGFRMSLVSLSGLLVPALLSVSAYFAIESARADFAEEILSGTQSIEELRLKRWTWLSVGDDWTELTSAYDAATEHLTVTPDDRARRIQHAFELLTHRGIADAIRYAD